MCIIIYRPEGAKLDDETYSRCNTEHKHGSGFCYVENGKLVVKKGFQKDEELLEAIKPYEGQEMLIHFRNASPQMVINAANCHPFAFNTQVTPERPDGLYQWAVVHNGRLEWRHTKDHSDTSCFVHDLLHPHFNRDPYMLDTEIGRIMLKRTINTMPSCPNKMGIMRLNMTDGTSTVYLINEEAGEWDTDSKCWFSNKTYKKKVVVTDDGIYHNADYYRTPDANGWKWDYVYDGWYNVNTKEYAEFVAGKTRPYNTDKYQLHTKARYNAWLMSTAFKTESEVEPKQLKLSAGDLAEMSKDKVQVPRDAGILPGKKEKSLDHLALPERSVLCVEAEAFYRRMGWSKREVKLFDEVEKITDLRDTVVELFDNMQNLPDDFVDAWIITHIKEGTFRMMMIEKESQIERMGRINERSHAQMN